MVKMMLLHPRRAANSSNKNAPVVDESTIPDSLVRFDMKLARVATGRDTSLRFGVPKKMGLSDDEEEVRFVGSVTCPHADSWEITVMLQENPSNLK